MVAQDLACFLLQGMTGPYQKLDADWATGLLDLAGEVLTNEDSSDTDSLQATETPMRIHIESDEDVFGP